MTPQEHKTCRSAIGMVELMHGSEASRRITSLPLGKARLIDHMTDRGSTKRSMSLGVSCAAAKQEPAFAKQIRW